MNWKHLKEKFPNVHSELWEFKKTSKYTDARSLINEYLQSKGFKIGVTFINQLKEIENK